MSDETKTYIVNALLLVRAESAKQAENEAFSQLDFLVRTCETGIVGVSIDAKVKEVSTSE